MTIRFKVVGMLAILFLISGTQALLILYLRNETTVARAEADRRGEARDLSLELELALVEMKAAAQARGTGRVALGHEYEGSVVGLGRLIGDPEQLRRLDHIEKLLAEWTAWLTAAGREEATGRSPADLLAAAERRLAPLMLELTALQERQDILYETARTASRRTADSASRMMLVMALVTMGLALTAILALGRVVLNPLASLAAAARRAGKGDYTEIPGASRPDEIGSLISAFTTMTRTVRDREAELSQALRHSLTITETVPAALLLIDGTDRIRSQNQAATALLGALDKDHPLHDGRFSLHRRDGSEVPVDQWPPMRALRGETVIGEDLTLARDGRHTPLVVSAAPLKHEQGHILGAVVALQDATALRDVDRLKDEFVSIVSHELRTPLTSIRGSLQLVLDDPAVIPDEESRHLITVALNNCERLIRIVNDILDISKLEAGKATLRRRPAQVRELVQTAIDAVADVARAAGVSFSRHIPDDIPPAFVDPDRMTQVWSICCRTR